MPTGSKGIPGPVTKEVAAILRAQLARKNFRAGDLADAVGISQPQLSKMLRGEKHIDVEQLDVLTWALGLSFVGVIQEADEEANYRFSPQGNLPRTLGPDVSGLSENEIRARYDTAASGQGTQTVTTQDELDT